MASASSPSGDGRRLPRERRITDGADIRGILRRGKRSGTAHLDVFDSPSPVPHPRAGVIVPKHRHTIVERNRLKRRIREAIRRDVLPILTEAGIHADVIVRARADAYGASWNELREQLLTWVERRWSRARYS